MEKFKIEPLSDTVLEASGWNAYWSGSSCGTGRRTDMWVGNIHVKQSDRYHIYTTSQLMELFSKRGRAVLRMKGRPDTTLAIGELMGIGVLFSTIKRNEEFDIILSECTSVTADKVIDGYTTIIEITICKFIKLSANSIKSKSNLGQLFEIHDVPLYSSQRRSLGLDLK